MSERRQLFLWLGLALVVGVMAVSDQSLWIDEGASAMHAMRATLPDLWNSLRTEANSNMQIVWYHLYLWGWEKVAGHSEVALRAANIPFFMIGVAALFWGLAPRRAVRPAVLGALLLSPFLWYYLGEARPYILLEAGACLLLAPVLRLALGGGADCYDRPAFWWLMCAGIVLMAGTSLVSLPWIVCWTLCLYVMAGWRFPLLWIRSSPGSLVVTAVAAVGLGLYFGWTLTQPFRTSPGTNTFQTVAFGFYEHLGFAGLGPGRTSLREGTSGLTGWPYGPLLALYGVTLAAIGLLAFGSLRRVGGRVGLVPLVLIFLPLPMVFLLGVERETRILGRHIAPFAPVVAVMMGAVVFSVWRRGWWPRRGVVVLFVLLVLASDLRLRFSPEYQRDDYRGAADAAKEALAANGNVLWAADAACAVYYGVLPFRDRFQGNERVSLVAKNGVAEFGLVALSKPDLYDQDGSLRRQMERSEFQLLPPLKSFTIWKKSPQPN